MNLYEKYKREEIHRLLVNLGFFPIKETPLGHFIVYCHTDEHRKAYASPQDYLLMPIENIKYMLPEYVVEIIRGIKDHKFTEKEIEKELEQIKKDRKK
jgi:hypothetical protein